LDGIWHADRLDTVGELMRENKNNIKFGRKTANINVKIRIAYYIHEPELTKLIFAVLHVS